MAKAPDVSTFQFRSAVLLDSARAVILAGHRELEGRDVPNTFAFMWRREGEWSGLRLPWNGGRVVAVGSEPEITIVGEGGETAILTGSGVVEGDIGGPAIISGVYAVGHEAIAVGLRGAFSRREPGGEWISGWPGIDRDTDLEALTGGADGEMVGVGWKGQVWRFSSSGAERFDAGTNAILTSVCHTPAGHYYSCGQRGVLVRGRGSQWEVIDHQSTSEDLWDVHWFQGHLYVASSQFLYRLVDGELVRVDFGDSRVFSCYHLTSFEDDILWSIGANDIMEFRDGQWMRIL